MPAPQRKRRLTRVNEEAPSRLFGLFFFAFVIAFVAWGASGKTIQLHSLASLDHTSSKAQLP
jgi:hypothetical protein